MGLTGKIWLLLLALVCGPAFGGALVRQQRQVDWWRHYQMPMPAQGSFRGASRDISSRPLVGLGSLRGSAQHRRGPNNWYSGGLSRQMQQPLSSPISVQCTENRVVVRVSRDFYGNGILVQPADLSLGSQSCKPSLQSNDTTVIFLNELQECGSTLQVTSDYLIYSSVLTYSPLANGVIIRSNPTEVPIHCIYPRHGNVSSKAIKPTWAPFSTTVSTQEKLLFSLTLMAGDWSGPRSSAVFQLGQSLNIEASVNTENHMSLIVFVDYCVATTSPDPNSSPNYDIIAANGCFIDAMRDDTYSAFGSPRIQQDKLRFTLEAFRFKDVDVSVIYITCHLRAVPASQVPDSMNKACSFNRERNSWSPVEGSSNICQCCFDGSCEQQLAPQGRRNFGRPRSFWKRRVDHHSKEHAQAVLGPLLVTEAVDHLAPRTGLGHISRAN